MGEITIFNGLPFSLRAGTGYQYLPHAVELSLGFAQVAGRLSASASKAFSVMPAQIRPHCRHLDLLDSVRLSLIVLAAIYGISGRVFLIRPVVILVELVLNIDSVGYRLRWWGRCQPIPLAAGYDRLQLRPTVTAATITRLRRFTVYGYPLHFPAFLIVAGGRYGHHFLTCNREMALLEWYQWLVFPGNCVSLFLRARNF